VVPREWAGDLIVTDHGTALGIESPLIARPGTARLLIEGMRPRQWVKNAFVLGGLLFSGESVDPGSLGTSLLVFGAFCLASGASYLVNDVTDAEADRHNVRTASRPIARGDLSKRAALVAAVCLTAVSLALVATVNWQTLATLAGFVLLQLAYSLVLKHVLFVDAMAIAGGFVLRAYAGLACIPFVGVSEWLLLCTGLIALFLAFGKRRAEAVAMGGQAAPQRPVLDNYSVALIDELITVVAPSTVVSYSLYAVLGARTQLMLLTVPFVLYGIFRALFLIHYRSALPEDPTVVVWQDRPLQACIVLWALSAGVISIIY
jgi:4-hydroxybenzoate polyprenyltransferase